MSDKNFRVRHGLEVDGSATLSGDLQVDGNDIKGSGGVTAITMNTGRVILADDLEITGNTVNLAQGTEIFYSDNNNRLNRPTIQSSTGNFTGLRVAAPNTTASATAIVSSFNTNDPLNGKFINIRADGSAGPLSIRTGEYVAGVFGASGDSIDFYDGNTNYASVNPAGPTAGTDLTTKTYVDAHPGTTYDIDATSATGGANLNLNGSDSTTDTVKFTGGTNITVTATSANEITISGSDLNTTYTIDASSTTGGANFNLVGSDSTTDTIKFASGTGVTVSQTSANEIGVAIGQPVATTDAVTFASVSANGVDVGASANTIAGTTLSIDGEAPGGGSVTVNATDSSPGNGAGQLIIDTSALTYTHTDGALVPGVTGTWSFNPNGTTSFPSYTFPYADGTPDQQLKTDGSGTLSWFTPTDLNTTYTIDASAATGGANFNLVGSDATTDTIKFAGSGATTVTQTSANEITISSTDNNTTYTQDASSTTGGANLNLVGSDATTDTIKFAGGTNVTVTATSASEITIDATDTNTTYTIDASSTTGGANFNLVGSDATTDTIKFAGSGATTVTQTSANEITISSTDNNTTYTIDASSTTGGANLNLVGSDSTTDTVKFAQGTGVSVTQTSANEMSIAIGQAVGTGDSPSFAGVTGGNLTVGVATDNTIASTDTNGNIVLDPNGSGNVVLASVTRLQGEMQASTNLNYTFPAQTLNTVTDNNGYSAASSFPAGTNGYGANAVYTHYSGDTLAGIASTASLNVRTALGNSTIGDTVPFTGLTSVAPSAITTGGEVLGTFNFNGYGTTGFTNDIATANQGGGINALHALQLQAVPNETFSDSVLTLTSANITAVASSFRAALGAPQVTGTKGQISFNATTPGVGNAIRVTGTLTGTATGIVSGQVYYIIVTNGSTTATLSATPGGSPIDTTAGTLTGLTLTRCGVTFTLSGQTNVPFGRGALVAVTNVTNVTDGTYAVFGTPTTTSVSLGIPHTVAPTLPGTQTFSCRTNYMGSGYRIRAFPLATPGNVQNRVELVNHSPASATYRSDAFTFAGGAYGNTGGTYLTLNNTDATFTKPIKWSGSTSGTVQISAPAVAGTQTYTLPTAQPTVNNQVLVATTAGVMSWANSGSTAANYLDANYTATIGAITANTIYGIPVTSLSANNITIATGAIAIDNATATGPTRITFAQTGRYNLQFSIQLENADNAADHQFDIWLRRNGTDVADSNTQYTIIKNNGKIVAALNLLLNPTVANDYYELVYAVSDANVGIKTIAAITTPYVRPQTPGIIVTVVPVGA